MDIKELNKSQLIMLALLVSFVTSIATGITTVTLMQQAPPSVTVPISHVVRETVEKILPTQNNNTSQTVVIKEEDLVVDAIAKNKPSVFSITKEGQDANGNTIEIDAGQGFVISTDGVVVADGSLVPGPGVYYVKNSSGKFKADFISLDKNGFSFLKIGAPVNGTDVVALTVPSFGDLTKMKAGQEIIILDNTISSFIFDGNQDLKIKSTGGGLVFDLDGDVLGISLSGTTSFVSINLINEALTTYETSLSGTTPTTTQ